MHCDQTDKQITLENHVHENQSKKIFCFDDLFLQHSTQEEVYERTGEKLVHEVMQGYNGTIFAYGQTGSGKTFTMMGNSKVSD
jgi:type II secretory ATPase GspE/PulE/Tfp pilus assembly ATPase PilB-like protein